MTKEYLETIIGKIEISGNEDNIFSITFVDETAEEITSRFIPKEIAKCIEQLQEYFNGERTEFELNLGERGTDYQRKVWAEIAKIPKGKTISYKKLGEQIGNTSPRAIGNATGKNPYLIAVPCHRVMGTSGDLTGYAGGKIRKEWLLKFEYALNVPQQLSLF